MPWWEWRLNVEGLLDEAAAMAGKPSPGRRPDPEEERTAIARAGFTVRTVKAGEDHVG